MGLKFKGLETVVHSVRGIRSGRVMKTTYINRNTPIVVVADAQSSIPWHAVFVFLILVLVEVLQMHCQGSNKSPIETHLPNMVAFLFAIFLYYSALGYYVKSRLYLAGSIHLKVSAEVAFISGSLASASVISVLVPRSFELLVFIVWMISGALYIALNNPILHMSKWLYHASESALSHMRKRIIGSNNGGATTIPL